LGVWAILSEGGSSMMIRSVSKEDLDLKVVKAKVYTDGSVNPGCYLSGSLRFLKNEKGGTVGLDSLIKYARVGNVNQAEAIAIKDAIHQAITENIPTEIYSDSEVAIRLVQNSVELPSHITLHKVMGRRYTFGNEAIDRLLYFAFNSYGCEAKNLSLERIFRTKKNLRLRRYRPLDALKEIYKSMEQLRSSYDTK
jgi:ribonuclease HI